MQLHHSVALQGVSPLLNRVTPNLALKSWLGQLYHEETHIGYTGVLGW